MSTKQWWMQKLRIFWYKVQSKLISSFVNLFASESNFDIKNTVLLMGSTRSGTTFLMESLNAENDYRVIFEPFNPTYTKEWRSFSARHYFDSEHVTEEEREALDRILSGKIHNHWIDRYNRKMRSSRRIIKAVRANLMLDYLEKAYPDLTIIYLYRNPYKVVASRINLNFDPRDVNLILGHRHFLDKYYSDIDLNGLKALLNSPEGCHAALWCLENRFILDSADQRRILVARFSDIIDKTVRFLDDRLEITDKKRRPSVTSSTQDSYQLSDGEKENIRNVLDLFGMLDSRFIN